MSNQPEYERGETLRRALEEADAFLEQAPVLFASLDEGDPVDVDSVMATILLCRDFIGLPLLAKSFETAPTSLLARQPLTEQLLGTFIGALQHTEDSLRLQQNLEHITPRFAHLRDQLKGAISKIRRRVRIHLTDGELDSLTDDVEGIEQRLRWIDATSSIESDMRNAQSRKKQLDELYVEATKTTGRVGEVGISSFYETFAQKENDSANAFRVWTIVAGTVAGLTAAAFLILPEFGILKIGGSDYAHLIQRVIVTAAILGVAGYFARQAQQHRTLANWASALAVQLQTFEAYIAPIDNQEAVNTLRASFAARAFGDHPTMKGETPAGVSPTAMDAAVDLVAKLAPVNK